MSKLTGKTLATVFALPGVSPIVIRLCTFSIIYFALTVEVNFGLILAEVFNENDFLFNVVLGKISLLSKFETEKR